MDRLILIVVVLIGIAGIIIAPVITILALNTLFPSLAIPYTFGTWAAAGWLLLVFYSWRIR